MADSHILPWHDVFGPGSQGSHRDLAVEVLVRPVILRRRDRRLVVEVDRRDARHAIVSHAGRLELAETMHREVGRSRVDEAEAGLQSFLESDADGEWEIPTRDIPLRWSSGGALPLVRQHGSTHVAFALRDVAPLGWNIALGNASEEDELNRPGTLAYREFLEESLVLDGPPDRPGTKARPFALPPGPLSDAWAWALTREHRLLRESQDALDLGADTPESAAVALREHPTLMSLTVIDREGQAAHTENVLVVISLLECGVEIVRVLEWELDPQDSLLDGELLHFGVGDAEFIRRPIRLVPVDALRSAFADGITNLPRCGDGPMPSFLAPEVFGQEPPDFDWDAQARQGILEAGSRPNGEPASTRERHRLAAAAPDYHLAASCITPSAAGALACWFRLGVDVGTGGTGDST